MNFSALPDHVMLQILRNLPVKDLVRAGGANSSLRRISRMVVSETKALHISRENGFGVVDRFTPQSLRALMNLCADNLEEIRFDSLYPNHEQALVATFAEFRCPNLNTFQCMWAGNDKELLTAVLRNNTNLKKLILKTDIRSYPDVTSEQLEHLECSCTEDGLQSMAGRMPNLKYFSVTTCFFGPTSSLNRFLATTGHLETLHVWDYYKYASSWDLAAPRTDASSIWRLNRLTELNIEDNDWYSDDGAEDDVDDEALVKVSQSFPGLRTVGLCTNRPITDRGIAALSALPDLRQVRIHCRNQLVDGPLDLSAGVSAVANKCPDLEIFEFYGDYTFEVTPRVLIDMLHRCPRLSGVRLWDLVGVESEEQAVAVLQSLAGLQGKRQIRIKFHTGDKRTRRIWRSKQVKDALSGLVKKAEYGVKVIVEWRYNIGGADPESDYDDDDDNK